MNRLPKKSWAFRCTVAGAAMLGAQIVTHSFWLVLQHTPFLPSFAAAILSSRVAGREAGFISIAMGVAGYLAFPPPLPVAGSAGLIIGFVALSGAFSWLVARRYAIEEELRASEMRLAEAQQLAHIGNCEWNVIDDTETWSDEVYRLLGVEPNAVPSRFDTFLQFVLAADRELLRNVVKQALADHQPFQCEYRIVRPNGQLRTLQGRGRVIVNDDGRVVRLVRTIQDITDRKAAEDTVRLSEHRLKTIIDAEPACVKLVSADGRLLEMNRAGLEMLGVGHISEIRDGAVVEMVHPADRAKFLTAHQAAVEGSPGRLEFRIVGLHRKERWVDSHMVPFEPSRLGTWQSVLSVTSDITERKQLEDQLRHAQKMEAIGRLAGGIAHDFNNVLTVIGGLTEVAAEDVADRPSVAEDLRLVCKTAHSAALLTKQLLIFSRREIVETTALDLNVVINDVEHLLRRTIRQDVRFELHAAQSLCAINGDAAQLQQVIMNLAVNARDAMPNGGVLTIATRNVGLSNPMAQSLGVEPGPYVELSVTDTGHGIAADTKTRMFEPFFTTKERGRGTGLGLSTVYAIVQNFGGAISVDSEVGQGASFKLYFPASSAEAVSAPSATDSPWHVLTGTETILLVEDDENVRSFTARVLRQAGYGVIEASTAALGFEIAQSATHRIDALVTDVIMPGMDGHKLTKCLRARRPDLKVLFMSGYAGDAMLSNGIQPLLEKPFTAAALLRKLRDVLGARPRGDQDSQVA